MDYWGGGGGGQRVCSPPPRIIRGEGWPPVPLFLRLCSLPNIYFSLDTVCLATVYPERERERKRVNDENYLEKREREMRYIQLYREIRSERQKLMKISWERES